MLWAAAIVVLAVAAAIAATFLLWPRVALGPSPDALARVSLPRVAGQLTTVDVRTADGTAIPVVLRRGRIWPQQLIPAGQHLTVRLTVVHPTWVAWLVGTARTSAFGVETPNARIRSRYLTRNAGRPLGIVFDAPVRVVKLGAASADRLVSPETTVSIDGAANGAAGQIQVAWASRAWETQSQPVRVVWFTGHPYPQVLARPVTVLEIAPDAQLTFTFSAPVSKVLGARRPRLIPAMPGMWRTIDDHTIAFQPSGMGYGLGTNQQVQMPEPIHVASRTGSRLVHTLQWQVKKGSKLRLQQLLAQLGYLPLDWHPAASDPASNTLAAQLEAAVTAPAGQFTWTYPNTPAELREIWYPGHLTTLTFGAIMSFERTHGMRADGLPGSKVWQALIRDVMAGKRQGNGYSYVFVHSSVPTSLNLWHNGKVILTSPGNTGVPAAPTQLGSFTVFEHIPVGTMSGTNPSGSHYNDPGIRWISYFNHGDAIHAFNRASFGTPQSLGCVELPLAQAAKVWPYTPVGTVVTIER